MNATLQAVDDLSARRTRCRGVFALLALAVLAFPAATPAAAGSDDSTSAEAASAEPWASTAPLREIAGRVTIEAPAGVSGIRFDLSAGPVRPNGYGHVVDTFDGAVGMVFGVDSAGPTFTDDDREMNVADWFVASQDFYPDLPDSNGLPNPKASCHYTEDPTELGVPCLTYGEVLEYYIASDEPITFTLSFLGDDLEPLPGHRRYVADGEVHGDLTNMDGNCPTGDCADLHHGGWTRTDIGYEQAWGLVGTWTYARHTEERLPTGDPSSITGSQNVTGCLYPSYLSQGQSPHAEDHPLGCTFGATVSGDGDVQRDTSTLIEFSDDGPTRKAHGIGEYWPAVHGPQYAGFNIRNRQYAPGLDNGSTGRWLATFNPGIH